MGAKVRAWVLGVALVSGLTGGLRAQAAAPMVVSADWVAQHLNDPTMVILHAGFDRLEYDAGHLPGARFIPFSGYAVNLTVPDTLRTELAPLDSLTALIERAGVSNASRIIVVGPPIAAARLFFTLAYVGLDRQASVLDGGVDGWRDEARPLSRDVPTVTRTSVTLQPHPELVARAADVRAIVADGGATVIDARAPEFYLGVSSNGFPRAGHVANAVSVPFSTVTREVTRFRDRKALEGLLIRAGVKPGEKVVTYCHIGQQASLLWFVSRWLGHETRLYDGSFQEWSRLSDAPVETAPRNGSPR